MKLNYKIFSITRLPRKLRMLAMTYFNRSRNDELKHRNFYCLISLLIFFLSFSTNILFAEVLRPIQIYLPGNLRGNLITFTEDQKAEGSEAFKIPYAIETYIKQNRDKDSLVFGIGNDSSMFKPFSYLNQGKAERELISKCKPLATALSSNDLEIFNDGLLEYKFKQRVFTNIEAIDEANEIFQRYSLTKIGKRNIYFFNFVSPDYCTKLPLERWSQIKIDDPARALRKINPTLTNNDYTLSVIYGDKSIVDELSNELARLNGIHFIIEVPLFDESTPLFSTRHLVENDRNIFRFSVKPGHKFLPILEIFPKNVGYPRINFRSLPLEKYSNNSYKNDFKNAWNQVRQEFHKPLKTIPITNRASTSANRISLQAHAQMLKYTTNSEIAFLKATKQISFRENVITVGNTITRFPNDRIIKFKATENKIKNMFLSMLQDGSISDFGFAGCQFSVLGNQYYDFKIGNNSSNPYKRYTIATTEETAKEFAVKQLLQKSFIETYDGLTLWSAWLKNLQTFPTTEENLFDY